MERLYLYIQCIDTISGITGSFYGVDSKAESPVYDSCHEAFDWANANGYRLVWNDPTAPCGLAVKES